jgi:hypothetical protein
MSDETGIEADAHVNQVARARAVQIVNSDKEKRLSEWNPHAGTWLIEVGIPGEATCHETVPHDAPGLNGEARHWAKIRVANPAIWAREYAAWVAGDGLPPEDARPSVPVGSAEFPEGPAFFNWDTQRFSVLDAKRHLASAKLRGAKVTGCTLCNSTAKGTECPVCGNPGLLENGAPDPVTAFRELVATGGNAFIVGCPPGADGILILNPAPLNGRMMTREEATNLAAWLIAGGGCDPNEVVALALRIEAGNL